MIILDIARLCKERGIKHKTATLMKAGISQGVIYKYLKGKIKNVPIDHIEKLCLLFRCQPNDLFTWVPDDKLSDYPENPMQAIRQKPSFNLEEKLKNMTLDEIKEKFGVS